MTREELIEVIRNALWRQVFARDEDAETMEYQKQVWDYDWERTLPKAKAMLYALEAAGVRLVPVIPTWPMIKKSQCSVEAYDKIIALSPYAPPEG